MQEFNSNAPIRAGPPDTVSLPISGRRHGKKPSIWLEPYRITGNGGRNAERKSGNWLKHGAPNSKAKKNSKKPMPSVRVKEILDFCQSVAGFPEPARRAGVGIVASGCLKSDPTRSSKIVLDVAADPLLAAETEIVRLLLYFAGRKNSGPGETENA
jgi:hypothetical protein